MPGSPTALGFLQADPEGRGGTRPSAQLRIRRSEASIAQTQSTSTPEPVVRLVRACGRAAEEALSIQSGGKAWSPSWRCGTPGALRELLQVAASEDPWRSWASTRPLSAPQLEDYLGSNPMDGPAANLLARRLAGAVGPGHLPLSARAPSTVHVRRSRPKNPEALKRRGAMMHPTGRPTLRSRSSNYERALEADPPRPGGAQGAQEPGGRDGASSRTGQDSGGAHSRESSSRTMTDPLAASSDALLRAPRAPSEGGLCAPELTEARGAPVRYGTERSRASRCSSRTCTRSSSDLRGGPPGFARERALQYPQGLVYFDAPEPRRANL
jgi:hypothetical protein